MVNYDNMTPELVNELKFTEAERKELAEAKKRQISFEDCPETTPERAIRFRRVNPTRKPIKIRA